MMENSQINLYDEDIIKIKEVVGRIEYKYKDAKGDFDTMWGMIVELEGRLHDIGFVADADWQLNEGTEVPELVVNIIERVDPISGFDFEKKQYEVQKAREKNEDIEEIS